MHNNREAVKPCFFSDYSRAIKMYNHCIPMRLKENEPMGFSIPTSCFITQMHITENTQTLCSPLRSSEKQAHKDSFFMQVKYYLHKYATIWHIGAGRTEISIFPSHSKLSPHEGRLGSGMSGPGGCCPQLSP